MRFSSLLYSQPMKISTRFAAAVHALLCVEYFSGSEHVTSEFIARSTNLNPVVIRRVLGRLKQAGLIRPATKGEGTVLQRPACDISLLDIYHAVCDGPSSTVFSFHPDPAPACPVGSQIHSLLDPCLDRAQSSLEAELKRISLADLRAQMS